MTRKNYENRIRAEVAAVRADTWDEGYRAGYADGFDEADSTGATRGTNPYADRAPAVQACSSEPHPPHASQVPGFVGCPGTPRFAPSPFEVVASGYVDRSEPGQIVITEGLPRMGENRLGADSVIEWDDLDDDEPVSPSSKALAERFYAAPDAHLDDMGE